MQFRSSMQIYNQVGTFSRLRARIVRQDTFVRNLSEEEESYDNYLLLFR